MTASSVISTRVRVGARGQAIPSTKILPPPASYIRVSHYVLGLRSYMLWDAQNEPEMRKNR